MYLPLAITAEFLFPDSSTPFGFGKAQAPDKHLLGADGNPNGVFLFMPSNCDPHA